jgi:hypothetical protein
VEGPVRSVEDNVSEGFDLESELTRNPSMKRAFFFLRNWIIT